MCAVLYKVCGRGVDHPPDIVPMVRIIRTMSLLPFFDDIFTFTFTVLGFRRVLFGTV
jgi:hypothetical protein